VRENINSPKNHKRNLFHSSDLSHGQLDMKLGVIVSSTTQRGKE